MENFFKDNFRVFFKQAGLSREIKQLEIEKNI
jgi:hypothetical protein